MAENIVTRVPLIGVLTPADMCGYVVESKYVQGSYIVVQTIAERNALTSKSVYEYNNVLQNGCPVYVAEEKKTYRYELTDRGPMWVLDTVDLTAIDKELKELTATDEKLSDDLADFKQIVTLSLNSKADKAELSNYATKSDLANVKVDLTGYATEDYVEDAIKNIALPDTDAIEQDIETVDGKVDSLKVTVDSISRDYMKESDGDAIKDEAVSEAKAYTDNQVTIINNIKADKSALNDYYTKTQVDSLHNAKVDVVTYNDDKITYATKNELAADKAALQSEITKTNAALSNKIDVSDLNNYYTKDNVDAKDDAIKAQFADYYTKTETAQEISTATASFVTKDTDQLTNYTTTASLNSQFDAIEQDIETVEAGFANYYTRQETDAQINAAKVSLDGYAKETYVDAKVEAIVVPTKISELENDKNYLTAVPSEYITETELNAKGYLTQHQSLDAYAKTEAVNNAVALKADDIPFTETYFVTKAIGDFVGDGTESLQGMTVREIFIKILGATLKVVYDSVTDQIIAEQLPVYAIDADGNVTATPYTYIEIAQENANAAATQSGFYQIKDAKGIVVESGYQEISASNGENVYHIAFPESVDFNTTAKVQVYDDMTSSFTTVWDKESNIALITIIDDLTVLTELYGEDYYNQIKSEEDKLSGYNMWLVNPEETASGPVYRFIIE